MTDRDLFAAIAAYRAKNVRGCLATIIRAAGSTPRSVGAKMLLLADGSTQGSIGGGCGENQARSAALRLIALDTPPQLLTVDLTDELGVRGGDVCGGTLTLLLESF